MEIKVWATPGEWVISKEAAQAWVEDLAPIDPRYFGYDDED